MADKIKGLLSVLDLPKEEQWGWVVSRQWEYDYRIDPQWQSNEFRRMALADLAFRLRDELKLLKHYPQFQARLKVYNYIRRNIPNRCDINHIDEYWWAMSAQPIHWIIAALIAKELTDEQK